MSVAVSPIPAIQVIQDGIPVNGALIFTYAAGTTTKLNTYTSSAGDVPNANPVVCDAQGRAVLYLTDGLLYKLVYAPPDDTDPPTAAYATYDNLYGNSVLPLPYADAGGTADVITATYLVNSPVLVDGYALLLDIGTTNATTTPTFAPTLNGVLQTARTIVKYVGNAEAPLIIGDLNGVAHLVYDLTNTKWILQNPASGTGSTPPKLSTITATVAASALTIGASSQYMDFRSATIGSGTISSIVAAPTALVVPSGATLGTVSGVAARLAVLEIINAGVAELAVVNAGGTQSLDERALITTTSISTGADSANVAYSTTGRTSVPFRVIGYLDITEATAGTWATAPSTIAAVVFYYAEVAASAVKSGLPQNSQSAAYTTVLADANKHLLHPTADNNARAFTIDSNANVPYEIGTTLTFANQINTVTIAITTDTLVWVGPGTTGSRALAANGMATALKIAATVWFISGTGLS